MDFEGKVALITGGSSGIGRAAVLRLAREGCAVGVLGHSAEKVERVVAEVTEAGGRAFPLVGDVASETDMKAAVDSLVGEFGRLDFLFANAGINGVWAPIDEITPEEWDRTINTNLRGTYLTLHRTVPHLKAAGGGSIVITSSINGTRTFASAGATAYSCTKAAQVAMAKMLALELAQHRIRVNVVCPGRIETEIDENTTQRNTEAAKVPAEYPAGNIPLTGRRPGTSEDVAELVLFLASDRSRHITGTPVWIDGAESLLVG
jgi:NAD(P)-dependent dehydrogenase (short-subunit alcohol dehydrogenase family)